ncbi:vWA domain-containing protein [Methyloceanibacter caenitepidi]|uniref:Mlr6511 protein n=1 Tax=Methyloceanibacter caenitepidi TaxID=1384459 RepID=A0A0A8K5X2_9HYPH|nr:VWA domain-containing protein [Methyloceanibacter caenitepidi]BAQ18211.1 Mlr6511 protein [Methyloceanibacter caenitepidi]
MKRLSKFLACAVLALSGVLAATIPALTAEPPSPCTEDAMIVFDASGSMSGNLDPFSTVVQLRIDEVRKALRRVLPRAQLNRKIGLVTYGAGAYNQCNVSLDLRPTPQAAAPIMRVVDALRPAGKTPLTQAIEQAAEVLDYRAKPGVIVVLTDGQETCDGHPCELGKRFGAEAPNLTVNVIGFRLQSDSWLGAQSYLDAKCLAEETGGTYLNVHGEDDLVKAFEQTLGCPMMSMWEPQQSLRAVH